MKRQTKLTPQEQQQLAGRATASAVRAAQEFASVEEMLRHDALHTPVPPAIAHRLEESISQLPPPSRRPGGAASSGG